MTTESSECRPQLLLTVKSNAVRKVAKDKDVELKAVFRQFDTKLLELSISQCQSRTQFSLSCLGK